MPRILVIEDDQLIRDVTVRILSAAGFDVLVAESGARAIEVWRERGADLVLTDIGLADVDGFQIVGELRTTKPELPVIIMSGNIGSRMNSRHDTTHMDTVSFLRKPFLKAQLLSAVAAALGDDVAC